MRYLGHDEALRRLEERLEPAYARRRVAMENDPLLRIHERSNDFALPPAFIAAALRLSGLYERGRSNAARIRLARNEIRSKSLPSLFDGFTILHLSDLHCDTNLAAMRNLAGMIADLDYDLCVMTGDYRGLTYGDFYPCLDAFRPVREAIRTKICAVLGNHDTILMVPDMESWGVSFLLNEEIRIDRGGESIFVAGVEDPHFLRTGDVARAAARIPQGAFSLLLTHTPEVYRQAAEHDFDVLLAGHTHGGQICLPGGVPVVLDAVAPRFTGRGSWTYRNMSGYTSAGAGTSIVPVRFNCPPEATLHRLTRA